MLVSVHIFFFFFIIIHIFRFFFFVFFFYPTRRTSDVHVCTRTSARARDIVCYLFFGDLTNPAPKTDTTTNGYRCRAVRPLYAFRTIYDRVPNNIILIIIPTDGGGGGDVFIFIFYRLRPSRRVCFLVFFVRRPFNYNIIVQFIHVYIRVLNVSIGVFFRIRNNIIATNNARETYRRNGIHPHPHPRPVKNG